MRPLCRLQSLDEVVVLVVHAVALYALSARVWAGVPLCDPLDQTTRTSSCDDPDPKHSDQRLSQEVRCVS